MLDFAEAGCTFCGDCHAVCPRWQGAFADAGAAGSGGSARADLEVGSPGDSGYAAHSGQQKIGLALLVRGACLAWQRVFCTSCVFACPEQAIPLDERRRPIIDAELCTGCGICVAPCPENAILIKAGS
jgi:Pyruvate/2-oxoacid:ferredoxin oxidoreductase delta subunit